MTLGDTVFLIDPLLSARGTWPDFVGTVNAETPNPTVDLPMSIDAVLADVDAVLLTHLRKQPSTKVEGFATIIETMSH